jgi:hypothetical protein
MRSRLLFAILFATPVLSGCPAYSLHGLFSDKEAVEEPNLVGEWVPIASGDQGTLTFEKNGDNAYKFIVSSPEDQIVQTYDVRLGRIGGELFMDVVFTGETLKGKDSGPFLGAIASHIPMKVKITAEDFAYAALEDDKIKKFPLVGKTKLPVEDSGGQMLVIATSDQLRQYITAHSGDVFSDFEHLKRKQQ